jgi:hypothetical protein
VSGVSVKRRNWTVVATIFLGSALLSGCAERIPSAIESDGPGFFMGIIHGYFILFSFIGSLFSDSLAVYAVPNNGGWYDFGFALGVGAFSGSAAASR